MKKTYIGNSFHFGFLLSWENFPSNNWKGNVSWKIELREGNLILTGNGEPVRTVKPEETIVFINRDGEETVPRPVGELVGDKPHSPLPFGSQSRFGCGVES